jgi:RNA polymerase subunit RPABC4/transcription elongation factor Spt4
MKKMTEMKFCPNCKRNVMPVRKWNTTALVLLILLAFPVGVIYAIVKRGKKCPICGTPEKAMLVATPGG